MVQALLGARADLDAQWLARTFFFFFFPEPNIFGPVVGAVGSFCGSKGKLSRFLSGYHLKSPPRLFCCGLKGQPRGKRFLLFLWNKGHLFGPLVEVKGDSLEYV